MCAGDRVDSSPHNFWQTRKFRDRRAQRPDLCILQLYEQFWIYR